MAGDNPATGGVSVRTACLIATCQAWESTASLPALLAQAGLDVAALSPGLLGLSSFVTRHERCSRDPIEAALTLFDHLARHRYDWIVVADEDLLAAVADAGTGQPAPAWFPSMTAPAAIVSKYAFVERMRERGAKVPASRFIESVDAATDWMRARQSPLVVKGDRGFGGREVCIAADVAAVRSAFRALAPKYGRVLIQEFVRGDNVSASVLYRHGEPIAWKASRTSCGYPDAHSASTLHESVEHPAIEGMVRAAGAVTGFHGFAGIDFVLDAQTDELFLLEFNPRPTLGLSGGRANRRFFAPAVRAFVSETPAAFGAYHGAPTQAYFPSHLLYALGHPRTTTFAHLRLCFGEMRWREWRMWSWLIARSVKNVLRRPAKPRSFAPFPNLSVALPASKLPLPQRSNS